MLVYLFIMTFQNQFVISSFFRPALVAVIFCVMGNYAMFQAFPDSCEALLHDWFPEHGIFSLKVTILTTCSNFRQLKS